MHVRESFRAQEIGRTPEGASLLRVLCEAAPVEHDGATWIQIMPFGPFVEARDGRSFQISDATSVAARSALPMLVDWEHQSESFFGSTRAAGWVEELRVEPAGSNNFSRPGVWGRVDWTDEGAIDVQKKRFRFLSPVLVLDAESRDVQEILSVALTNRPALEMAGINSYRQRYSARLGAEAMKPDSIKLLLTALALAEGATEEQIVEAARSLKASSAADKELCAKLSGDLSASQTRVTELETKLAAADKAAFANEVRDVLDTGAREGRVTPGARKGYEEFCLKSREHFESFKTNVLPNLPKVGEPAPKSAPVPTEFSTADVDVEKLRASGMSEDRIKAALEYQKKIKASRATRSTESED